MNPFYFLLVFVPVSVALKLGGASELLIFATSALAILPLAKLMGDATEELSLLSSATVGAFLNATFGNATELIIAAFAIKEGLLELVKASITGSIIGNLLLVLGLSMLLGGIKHREQAFNREVAGVQATMLLIAIIGLVVPSIFSHADGNSAQLLSDGVAVLLLIVYVLGLVFTFVTHKHLFDATEEYSAEHIQARWSRRKALSVLAVSTIFVALESEILTGVVEEITELLGLTELFIGVVVIAIIGNAAEHGSAVAMAMKNKMDLSIGIATTSTTQIALFVVPMLVFAGILLGNPLLLVFNVFELVAIVSAVLLVNLIASDGKCNWLEGAQLLVVYLILVVAFYFI